MVLLSHATVSVTLVHNDINPSNVVVHDSVVKLNDFNNGVLMTFNEKAARPCKLVNNYPTSQWRAPEKQMLNGKIFDVALSEKVDIYALGNIFFCMIGCN